MNASESSVTHNHRISSKIPNKWVWQGRKNGLPAAVTYICTQNKLPNLKQ